MTALNKIRKAGFKLNLVGENIEVIPFSNLSSQQREFLKSHKAEIIGELRAETTKPLIVTCYTPNGNPMEVEARDQEHAEFLQRMNPKPTPKGTQP